MPKLGQLSPADLLTGLVRKLDNWQSLITGLGNVFRDKGTAQAYQRQMPKPFQYYSDLYHGDPIARRVAEIPAREMLRQGFRLDIADDNDDGELSNAVLADYKRLNGSFKLFQALSFARALGGCVVYMQCDDGLDPIEPLDLSRVSRVRELKVVPRNYAVGVEWKKTIEEYGEIETYQLTILSPSGVPGPRVEFVHESRCIRFDGILGTDEQRARNQGWGDSIYLSMEEGLGRVGLSFAALSAMLADASQGVMKIKGLIDQITDTAMGEQVLRTRMRLMDMARSVARAVLLDAEEEEFEYADRTFSGVPESLDRIMYLASAITGIPVTLLFGRAPAGLNATGESDIRLFYDLMKSEQVTLLEPRQRRLLEVIMAQQDGPAGGDVPETYTIHYNPLFQLSEKEQADVRLVHAQADAIDLEWGVTTAKEVADSHYGGDSYNPNITLNKELREAQEGAGAGDDSLTEAQALQGQQVTSMLSVIQSAAKGEIPREAAVQMLVTSYALSPDDAERILGPIGQGFQPTAAPAPASPTKPAPQKPFSMPKT